jgi:lipoprotein-releasing system permease protein
VDNNCYVNIRLAQLLSGFNPGQASKLYVRVNDLAANTSIARMIEQRTNYLSATWEESAQSFMSLFKMITSIVYFLTFFVILVSGFSVANVLITNVLEKTREIAIMKSMGYRRNEIMMIYVFQGLFVAVVGAIVGSSLGFGMIQVLASIPIEGSKSGVIRSDHLEMGKSIWYFVSASGFAVIISLLASVGPARNAARVNPVELLRGEH